MAQRRLRHAGGSDTLSTTALVHETYLRLARGNAEWENRAHFFGAAARAMRQTIVDYARRRRTARRGGELLRMTVTTADRAWEIEIDEVIALDDALQRLQAVDERLHRVVELRFFGGLTEETIAELLGVTPKTVERDWVKARLFLVRLLRP